MRRYKNVTILGVDPGFAITGYGILRFEQQKLSTLTYGVITTKSGGVFDQRLKTLFKELDRLIKKYHPDVMAVEELYFSANAKTAIKVGQARGVAVIAAALHNLKIYNYTPLQVKQALTSYGKADKKQIQSMIKTLLNLNKIPKPDDAADALAVAYTCLQYLSSPYDH